MRVILVASLIAAALGSAPLHTCAQPTDPEAEARERIVASFQNGNAERLLTPAAERVEASILGMQTYYSRAQALFVLQDFFKNFVPREFAFGDVSRSEEDFFATGQYWYGQAERPLQVYVRLTRQEEAWVLQEIRLNRSER